MRFYRISFIRERCHLHLFVLFHANEISLQKRGQNCVSYTTFLVKSPTKTIKNGRDQHFQESTLGGFSKLSVTRVSERGRGAYHEIIKVWKFRLGQLRWVRNNPTYITSIEDLKFISWCYNCQVLPSLNKVFTSLHYIDICCWNKATFSEHFLLSKITYL